MFQPGHTPVQKGRSCTVQPIVKPEQIAAIKQLLRDEPQDLALFTLGINSAFRAGDLVNLRRDDVTELEDARLQIDVIEQKTKKRRVVVLNLPTSQVVKAHLACSSGPWLFSGQRGRFSVATIARKLKSWAAEVGVQGRIASHSLRKTFTRQHLDRGAKITTLMHTLNHSSERQTLAYCGILAEDVAALYATAI